jgi:hypothetical protein
VRKLDAIGNSPVAQTPERGTGVIDPHRSFLPHRLNGGRRTATAQFRQR